MDMPGVVKHGCLPWTYCVCSGETGDTPLPIRGDSSIVYQLQSATGRQPKKVRWAFCILSKLIACSTYSDLFSCYYYLEPSSIYVY